MKLPSPDRAALNQSHQLCTVIRDEIQAKGPISFARFMELALYHPSYGYYSSGKVKFGVGGDFVTAPELSPLFSRCVAQQCQQVLCALPDPEIIELGAGSGVMALELLQTLARLQALPRKYSILEISPALASRQQQLFAEKAPELLSLVQWIDHLPRQPISGIILANEVCDAIPVHRFNIDQDVQEYFVDSDGSQFVWQRQPANDLVRAAIAALEIDFPQHYTSEINLQLSQWITKLAAALSCGMILLLDYGYTRAEYYHPQRSMGTFLCHYQHYAHEDPFFYPGIQDITAFVDFTAIAIAAVTAQVEVSGFTNQATFLLNCGLLEWINSDADPVTQYTQAQQIKRLTLPNEMGERFKVMALTKQIAQELVGFSHGDQTERL